MYHTFYSFPLGKAWVKGYLFPLLILLLCISCNMETKAERYAREARETTALCPMAIVEVTVMDSLTYTPDTHCFTYYYKVSGIEDSLLRANEESFRRQIIDLILNSTDMIPYVQDGMTFRYVYRTSATGTPVMDIVYESSKEKE